MSDPALKSLADLYRRSDGTMRNCNHHNETERCNLKQCRIGGCDRANEILCATNPLTLAAIAVARSEAAASTPAPGEPEGQAHEPWPEMDALAAALDVVAPGWRV